MEKLIKTCTSIDCPERKSLCCGAISTINNQNGDYNGRFVCSSCGKPFVGGECTAGVSTPPEWEMEFDKKYGAFELCDVVSYGDQERLKDFIKSLLSKTEERVKKELEEKSVLKGERQRIISQIEERVRGEVIEEIEEKVKHAKDEMAIYIWKRGEYTVAPHTKGAKKILAAEYSGYDWVLDLLSSIKEK